MRSLWVGQRHIFLNLQYFQIQHQNSQMTRQTKEVTKLEDFYSFLSDFCETTISCCVGETKTCHLFFDWEVNRKKSFVRLQMFSLITF